jgi:hypothetical protein
VTHFLIGVAITYWYTCLSGILLINDTLSFLWFACIIIGALATFGLLEFTGTLCLFGLLAYNGTLGSMGDYFNLVRC